MDYEIRDFRNEEGATINKIALAAFEEYRAAFSDWPAFSRNLGNMAALAPSNEIIVACAGDRVVGAVAYVGPGKPKSAHFKIEWPLIRMLSVEPSCRGHGIGRVLTEECIRRAQRDDSPVIPLHTAHMMKIALPMYLRMGFEFYCDAPPIFGVPYGIYLKLLRAQRGAQPDAEKQRAG